MPEKVPYFFFSYARRDHDRYLEAFYKDLRDQVKSITGTDEVGFQDVSDIEPGDDYDAELAKALRVSPTLVCLYSPSYFTRPYCGKEFRVFLDRQPGVRYEGGAARESEKIIPVLWLRKKDLERLGLPPEVARFILYSVGPHQVIYEEQGLKGILRRQGRKRTYVDIIETLADQIVERATGDPLPPLPEPPVLTQVPSAFEAPPPLSPAPAAPRGQGGPAVLVPVYLAASEAEVEGWELFPREHPGSLRILVRELAAVNRVQCLDGWLSDESPSAAQDAAAVLRSATARNQIPLLVVNPTPPVEPVAKLLRHVLGDPEWRGGVLVAASPSDARASGAVASLQTALAEIAPDPERVVVKTFVGSHIAFEAVFGSLLTELQRRVVIGAPVQRQVASEGPARRPLITGPSQEGAA